MRILFAMDRARMLLPIVLAGCAGPLERNADQGQIRAQGAEGVILHELPAGTVLRLPSVRVVSPAPASADDRGAEGDRRELGTVFCDALWRTALRQSTRFDIAAGLEDGPSPWEVELVHDPAAAALTASLRGPAEPSLLLGGARIAPGGFAAAIDSLAGTVLRALGDRNASGGVPSALAYSGEPACVRYCERALREASRGETTAALGYLRKARPLDPGCTQVLAALAALHLERGELAEADRVAREALQLERRLDAPTKHRLARALVRARGDDAGLLQLAEVTLTERPHDPQVLWSKALALSLLGRQAEAMPALRFLASRWPTHGAVRWHLCLAELAAGQPERALATIEEGIPYMPKGAGLRPRCLALFHAGKQPELARVLEEAAATAFQTNDPSAHELCRMRAAHAILTGDRALATRLLLEDVAWTAARPSGLESHTLDLVEACEVLIRFGKQDEVKRSLAGLESLRPMPELVADALTYLGGLVEAASGRESVERAEAALRAQGRTVWSGMLRAALHRQRGELQDEAVALTEVVQASDAALARASLGRVLRISGLDRDAALLMADLKKRLLVFTPRELARHPLASPATALAWISTDLR